MFQAFELGPFLIWTRLAFMFAGIWVSTELFLRLAESANLSLQHFRDHSVWYAGAFVIVGRMIAMLSEYKAYVQDPLRIVFLSDGNFSFLGGAIGIGIVLYFATRGHRTIFLQWLDALLPAVTLGLVFSWFGSFFAGDAYGRPTDAFWGITYDAVNVRYTIPVHPVQLYYAFFYLLLAFLLLIIRKKAKRVGSETLCGIVIACLPRDIRLRVVPRRLQYPGVCDAARFRHPYFPVLQSGALCRRRKTDYACVVHRVRVLFAHRHHRLHVRPSVAGSGDV